MRQYWFIISAAVATIFATGCKKELPTAEAKNNPTGSEHWQQCWVRYENDSKNYDELASTSVIDYSFEPGYRYLGQIANKSTILELKAEVEELLASPNSMRSPAAKQYALKLQDCANTLKPGDVLLKEASRAKVETVDNFAADGASTEQLTILFWGTYGYSASSPDVCIFDSKTDSYTPDGATEPLKCEKSKRMAINGDPYSALGELVARKPNYFLKNQLTGRVVMLPYDLSSID